MQLKWNFPYASGGMEQGEHYPGMEFFEDNRIGNMAREICQNSLDAAIAPGETPVRVTFRKLVIPQSIFPDIQGLVASFSRAVQKYEREGNDTAARFCRHALVKLKRQHIPVMQISDFGTTGLTGSQLSGANNWFRLTRRVGDSGKSANAGGSFGIGKYAPVICSDIHTVLYSTLDIENVKACQGVAYLPTFPTDEGDPTQGPGFLAESDDNAPAPHQLMMGGSPERNEPGTDLFVMSFIEDREWEVKLAAAVLDSFFAALGDGKLEVHIGDTYVINSETMGPMIESLADKLDEFGYGLTRGYHAVESSTEAVCAKQQILGLGVASLKVLIGPEYADHRRVAQIRSSGMKINDRSGFPKQVPFCGVLRMEGSGLNNYLKQLESPRHDDWQTNRAVEDGDPEPKLVLKELGSFVRNVILEAWGAGKDETVDAGIWDLLPDDLDVRDPNQPTSKATGKLVALEKTKPTRRVRPNGNSGVVEVIEYSEGGDVSEYADHDGDKPMDVTVTGKPPAPHDDESHRPGSGRKRPTLTGPGRIRVVRLSSGPGVYRVTITPAITMGDGFLRIQLGAESSSYPASIRLARLVDGTELSVSGNTIAGVRLAEGETFGMEIELENRGDVAIEVGAYAND